MDLKPFQIAKANHFEEHVTPGFNFMHRRASGVLGVLEVLFQAQNSFHPPLSVRPVVANLPSQTQVFRRQGTRSTASATRSAHEIRPQTCVYSYQMHENEEYEESSDAVDVEQCVRTREGVRVN